MSRKPDYSKTTWERICRIPFMVAIAMEGSGQSGVAGSARERQATIKSILQARQSYPENLLIREILPKGAGKEALVAALRQHDAAMDQLESRGIRTREGLWSHLESCLRDTLPEIRATEGGQIAGEFTEWLLRIASSVALSAKEGDFMGIGGERFSAEEQAFYNALAGWCKE